MVSSLDRLLNGEQYVSRHSLRSNPVILQIWLQFLTLEQEPKKTGAW